MAAAITTSPRRRAIRTAVVLVLCGSALGLIALHVASIRIAERLTAPCRSSPGAHPKGLSVEDIKLTDANGLMVAGWTIPVTQPLGVVVLLHGIRGSRGSMIPRARFLAAAGYASVLIDLHAHGSSDGGVITLGAKESLSVQAAVDYAQLRFPCTPTFAIGVSLGGAALLLAPSLELDGLAVESVFPDVVSAIRNRVRARLGPLAGLPSRLLIRQVRPRLGIDPDELRPIDGIAKVTCPVFVMGGALDPHTTMAETQRLHEAAATDKQLWIVPGAAHVDLHQATPKEYELRVLKFLNAHRRN